MDTHNQDHLTTQSSGDQESNHGHGGPHLCNRCGWPFPNPHPSAKHRRTHKKHCGTIQGYTFLESEYKPLSIDGQSDDDPKTPSPKPVQKTLSKTGSAGIGSMSNRSEDELFSDAATDFQETGTNYVIEGNVDETSNSTTCLEEANKSNRKSTDHLKDNSATDSTKPPGSSTDITESQIPELVISMPEHEKHEFSIEDQSEAQKIAADDDVAEKSSEEISLERNVTEENENFHSLSLPDDIHVVENAETILQGFKGHKAVNLEVPRILDFSQNVENKEEDLKDCASKENFTSSPTKPLGESTEIHSSEKHVLEETHNSRDELEFLIASFERGVNKDVVDFETESNLPQITPISDNESKRPVRNLEYEDGNTKPMVEKRNVEGETNISETELDDNSELDQGNEKLVVEEKADVIDGKLTDIEEHRLEETIVKQADGPPFDLENKEAFVEQEVVLEEKFSNNVGLNEMETHADKLENEDEDDKLVVKDLIFEREADLPSIEVGNDKGLAKSEIITDALSDNDMNLVVTPLDTESDQKADLLVSNGSGNQECGKEEEFDLAENDDKISKEKNNAESTKMTSESIVINTHEGNLTETERAQVVGTRGLEEFVNEVRLGAESSRNGDGVISSRSFEENSKIQQQFEGSGVVENKQGAALLGDVLVDSSSQTDSLEGNWGSVSVLSMQSDTTAFLDGDEKNNSQKPKGTPESLHSDKSDDLFEAPSIMTSIKSNDEKVAEIQTLQNPQEQTTSHERKKNEQIIEKVTNWSTTESGKQQHTPLKSLLIEAKPKAKGKQTLLAKMDENDDDDSKVGSKPGGEVVVGSEAAKEWHSPARYPADIKREKRKMKPYWAQFMCCSSVN